LKIRKIDIIVWFEKSLAIYKIGKSLFDTLPFLRPILRKGQMAFKPKFTGWGMSTFHENPDLSRSDDVFRRAFSDVHNFDKKNFHSYDNKTIDGSLWRFWFVSYAARHARIFAKSNVLAECGVGMGYTAFFALNEFDNPTMHLYDSWEGGIRQEQLTSSETMKVGFYKDLDMETTKKNLARFEKNTMYHKGYIPETFDDTAPKEIGYLHIDLNSSKATKEALEFFIPRLVNNGIILFDEYGYKEYFETRQVSDKILESQKGNLLKLPTGQAIYQHKI